MIDKAKSDKLINKMRKEDKSEFCEDLFTFDSFSDDDNLLQLDDLDINSTTAKTQQTATDLGVIDEEFDDYDSTLKQLASQDLESLQMKLNIELSRDEIEQYLGIDTEDTLRQQLISLDSEMTLLEKEEKLLLMELEDLEAKDAKDEAVLKSKENICNNTGLGATLKGLKTEQILLTNADYTQQKLENNIEEFNLSMKETLDQIGTSITEMISLFLPDSSYSKEAVSKYENIQKVSMSGVETFSNSVSAFVNKLLTVHDSKLHELKLSNKKSTNNDDKDMQPLINSAFEVEKHFLCTQIREMRSKISLSCIKNNKVVTESDANEEKVKMMSENTAKLFQNLLKEIKKNSTLKVHKLYKIDASENSTIVKSSNDAEYTSSLRQIIKL